VYFKVHDVAKAFKIETIYRVIINQDSGYVIDEDYKYFTCKEFMPPENNVRSGTTINKTLFLTYNGMMHVLYASRNQNARHFQKWASDKLFTD
jgi:prophage antirepressor-like protein